MRGGLWAAVTRINAPTIAARRAALMARGWLLAAEACCSRRATPTRRAGASFCMTAFSRNSCRDAVSATAGNGVWTWTVFQLLASMAAAMSCMMSTVDVPLAVEVSSAWPLALSAEGAAPAWLELPVAASSGLTSTSGSQKTPKEYSGVLSQSCPVNSMQSQGSRFCSSPELGSSGAQLSVSTELPSSHRQRPAVELQWPPSHMVFSGQVVDM
mmetsp:Transcript_4916/g.14622  ORF Transcript_4916/g.14622 Transcript_4916/m.14622 type:complete len:213 (-) Transcript_4916:26-664(-)